MTVLDWVFTKGGFEAIGARALNENAASINMLEKIGFEYLEKSAFEGKIAGKDTEWQNFKITKENYQI